MKSYNTSKVENIVMSEIIVERRFTMETIVYYSEEACSRLALPLICFLLWFRTCENDLDWGLKFAAML